MAKSQNNHVFNNKLSRNPFAQLPREVSVLSAVAFFVAVGFGLIIPAIPFSLHHSVLAKLQSD